MQRGKHCTVAAHVDTMLADREQMEREERGKRLAARFPDQRRMMAERLRAHQQPSKRLRQLYGPTGYQPACGGAVVQSEDGALPGSRPLRLEIDACTGIDGDAQRGGARRIG